MFRILTPEASRYERERTTTHLPFPPPSMQLLLLVVANISMINSSLDLPVRGCVKTVCDRLSVLNQKKRSEKERERERVSKAFDASNKEEGRRWTNLFAEAVDDSGLVATREREKADERGLEGKEREGKKRRTNA